MTDPGREVGQALAVCAGLLVMAGGGGAEGLIAAAALLPCALAPWFRDRLLAWPFNAALVLAVVALVAVGTQWGMQPTVSVGLVVLLLHQRLAAPADRWDRLVVLLVALMLVSAMRTVQGPLFLGCWLAWTASLPFALATGDARPGRTLHRVRLRQAALLVVLSMGVFVVLPRRDAGLSAETRRALIGLTEQVRPGAVDDLLDDASEVARARSVDGGPAPTRLRGAALERFDGQAWTRGAVRGVPQPQAGSWGVRVEVEQEALGGMVLMAGTLIGWGQEPPDAVVDEAGAWWTSASSRMVHVGLVDPDHPAGPYRLSPEEVVRNLALPVDLDARIRGLARSAVGDAVTPEDRLRAITNYVAGWHTWSTVVPEAEGDPLVSFLLEHRTGHCEYFASATAVLARASGLPARVVVGLVEGERRGDSRLFRASDAHAWTEVHLDGVGWVTVDTTGRTPTGEVPVAEVPEGDPLGSFPAELPQPAWAWDPSRGWERLRSYDGRDQRRMVEAALSAWPIVVVVALGAGLIGGVAMWTRRWRRRVGTAGQPSGVAARHGVAGHLDRAFLALTRRGLRAPRELAPLEAARFLAPEIGTDGPALVQLAWLYYEVVHGGADEATRLDRAEALAEDVVMAAGRIPGG